MKSNSPETARLFGLNAQGLPAPKVTDPSSAVLLGDSSPKALASAVGTWVVDHRKDWIGAGRVRKGDLCAGWVALCGERVVEPGCSYSCRH